jgi:hypothetical protein
LTMSMQVMVHGQKMVCEIGVDNFRKSENRHNIAGRI